jgi:type I restriction enzyme M protein
MASGTTNIGFEEKLWQAADKLRSNMDAAVCFASQPDL